MASSPTTDKPLTLVEVAQRLGVSKSTVSAAFTGKGTITAARREAVRRAASELGYEPNPHAQRLVQGSRTDMVCLYTPPLGPGSFTQVIERLQWSIVERGLAAPIHVAGRHPGEAAYQLSVLRGLRLQRPTAMVCCLRNLLPDVKAELRRYMASDGILIGADGFEAEDIGSEWVRFDRAFNAYLAVKYLLDNGHRKVGVFMPSPSRIDKDRPPSPEIGGVVAALAECGLTLRPDWFIRESYYEHGGMQLAARFLALDERPTAMFIVNDNAASAFVQQLHRAGLSVPGDVSVIGHDDAAAAAACMTPLTTISWPVDAMVENLEELLYSRLNGLYNGERRSVIVRGELRVRDSVSPVV